MFAYDAHGHGRSEPLRPHNLDIHDVDHLASDVVDFLLSVVKPTVGDKPLFCMGLSMGGMAVVFSTLKEPTLCDVRLGDAGPRVGGGDALQRVYSFRRGSGGLVPAHVRVAQ